MKHTCERCGRDCACPDYTPRNGCMTCGREDCDAVATALAVYRERVSAVLQRRFGITWVDAGAGDALLVDAMRSGQLPADLVDWYGTKYDLDPVDAWG